MRLVFKATGEEVKVGSRCKISDSDLVYVVDYFRPPHKPSSEGKVSIRPLHGRNGTGSEYYVSVIGAEWIEREDRL